MSLSGCRPGLGGTRAGGSRCLALAASSHPVRAGCSAPTWAPELCCLVLAVVVTSVTWEAWFKLDRARNRGLRPIPWDHLSGRLKALQSARVSAASGAVRLSAQAMLCQRPPGRS